MAEQINIFVENKPGRINTITGILEQSEINMRAIVIADRENFGIIKVLVDNPRKAQLALAEQGFACALKKVLAVVIKDQPGGLHKLTQMLFSKGINILDAYGFVIQSRNEAVLCIEVKEYDASKAVIEQGGFRVLDDSELYEI